MNTRIYNDIKFYEYYDGYWISKCGLHASEWKAGWHGKNNIKEGFNIKNNKPKPDNRKGYKGDYMVVSWYPFKKDVLELQEKYLYHGHWEEGMGYQKDCNPDRFRIETRLHRLVMFVFKPLDEYCEETKIITKKDWKNTPPACKKLLAQQMVVDHIDGNRTNNNVNNLRWCTSQQNAIYAVKNRKKKKKEKQFNLEEFMV